MRAINRFIVLALMWVVGGWLLLALPDSGVAYATSSQCETGQRRCTGRLAKGASTCYKPGDERCVRGRVCKITEKLCEGHLCKRGEPNCRSPFRLQRNPPINCYDPKKFICNVSSRKGEPTCGQPCEKPGWLSKLLGLDTECLERRRCKGLYGDRCYYPSREICVNGRTCPVGRRACESPTNSECYSPEESVCLSGSICKIGEQICRGRNGTKCFNPREERCFDGIPCANDERLCTVKRKKTCHPIKLACGVKK